MHHLQTFYEYLDFFFFTLDIFPVNYSIVNPLASLLASFSHRALILDVFFTRTLDDKSEFTLSLYLGAVALMIE